MSAREDWMTGDARPVMFVTEHRTRADAERLLDTMNEDGPAWTSGDELLLENTCPDCGERTWRLGMITPSDAQELPDLEEAVAVFAEEHGGALLRTTVLYDEPDCDDRPWRGYRHEHGNRAQRRRHGRRPR
jgi:hypothetical protein